MAGQRDIDAAVSAMLEEHPDETGSLGVLADLVEEVHGEAKRRRLEAVISAWAHLRAFLTEFYKDDLRRQYQWTWFWMSGSREPSSSRFVDKWVDPHYHLPTKSALMLAAVAHAVFSASYLRPARPFAFQRLTNKSAATTTSVLRFYRGVQLSAVGLVPDTKTRIPELNMALSYSGALYLGRMAAEALDRFGYYTPEELDVLSRAAHARYARRRTDFLPSDLYFRGHARPSRATLTILFGCDPYVREYTSGDGRETKPIFPFPVSR